MKSLLKLAVVVIVGLLIYNTFFGTAEEKQQANKIWGAGKSLVNSVSDLVKSEKVKYEDGKYDDAMDNITDWLEKAKNQAEDVGEDMPEQVAKLQEKKKEIDDILAQLKKAEQAAKEAGIRPEQYDVNEPINPELSESLMIKLKDFANNMDQVNDEMDKRFKTTTVE